MIPSYQLCNTSKGTHVYILRLRNAACLFKDGVGSIMEEPDGGNPLCDSQVVQMGQEGYGIKREQLLCQASQSLQVIHNLHAPSALKHAVLQHHFL